MKIRASYGRKLGLPGYSSVSASCEIESDTKATDPDRVAEVIRAAYLLAQASVDEQLSVYLGAFPIAPTEQAGPDRDRAARPEPENGRADRQQKPERREYRDGPEGSRKDHNGNFRPGQHGYDPDEPSDPRQLLAMIRRWDKEDSAEYLPALTGWAKRQGYGWRVIQWERAEVEAAVEFLRSLREDGQAEPEPEPEPAPPRRRAGSGNGHAGRNGGGRPAY